MSDIPSGPLDAAESRAVSLLSRVILPRPGEPLDVRKLYIEESETNSRRAHAPSRTTLEIGPESEVSFATYFNAFPASYWRRWSTLESVVLRVELTGSARVDVYRSKATGSRITVGGAPLSSPDDDTPAWTEFEIGLDPFEDGGWIWFDITTDTAVTVHSAAWYAPVPAPGRANIAIGIPTFNRPADCVNALRRTDIGSVGGQRDRRRDRARTRAPGRCATTPTSRSAAAPLGDRLSIHDQPNLGGSGGYSRVMYEALKNTDCEQILFMDDDIRIEPDSILRALALSRFAKAPTLVGGQMLNLQERSHLHVMGEVVDRGNFMWTNAPFTEYDHDFAKYPLADEENRARTAPAHRRRLQRLVDVHDPARRSPRSSASRCRCSSSGTTPSTACAPPSTVTGTVTMPGTAIWHMAWSDKDDAIDWQAYFHLRNRLVVAAMHWDGDTKGLLASPSRRPSSTFCALSIRRSPSRTRRSRTSSPGRSTSSPSWSRRCPRCTRCASSTPTRWCCPGPPRCRSPSGRRKVHKPPVALPAIGIRLARGVMHQLRKEDPAHHTRPELNVATQDARWFLLCKVDGVTVTTADGRGVVYRQRDRAKMFALLRAVDAPARPAGPQVQPMRRVYREALPVLTSKQKWETVLLESNSVPGNA